MVSGEYGPGQNYQVPVISIGSSIPYSNQTLWLRMDLPQLRQTTADTIEETAWVIRKRLGEPGILLPPQERYWERIGKERNACFEENLKWAQNNTGIFQKVIAYYRDFRYPFIPALDRDASLYQIGFYSRADEKVCRLFHQASADQKPGLIGQLSNPTARALAKRVLYRNYPRALPDQFGQDYRDYMARVNPASPEDAIEDCRGNKRTTPIGALVEINQLKEAGELDDQQRVLLDDLGEYIRSTFDI
jgi:exodeoxyribonuclease-1